MIIWVANVPPRHCGPFSDFQLMYHVFTHWLMKVRGTKNHSCKKWSSPQMFFSCQGQYFCAGDARGSCSSFGLHHLARHNNTNIGEKLKLMTTRDPRSKSRCFLLSPSGTSGLSRQCWERALRTSKLRFCIDCVTRVPLLYFIRSWVALSFKVCQWVSESVRHR